MTDTSGIPIAADLVAKYGDPSTSEVMTLRELLDSVPAPIRDEIRDEIPDAKPAK